MARFKLRRKRTPGIKLCPKCLKPALRPSTNVAGWAATPMYECTDCGYVGAFFVEVDPSEVEQARADARADGSEASEAKSDAKPRSWKEKMK